MVVDVVEPRLATPGEDARPQAPKIIATAARASPTPVTRSFIWSADRIPLGPGSLAASFRTDLVRRRRLYRGDDTVHIRAFASAALDDQ
jgi:hypothetical protein